MEKNMTMPLDVLAFMKGCDQEPGEETAKLYAKLIEEEFYEFRQALYENDNVEQLDACMDMIWVILSYCWAKKYNISGAWDEVTKTNLSKIDSVTGKVRRREDGKILKPEGWKEPDFSKFV